MTKKILPLLFTLCLNTAVNATSIYTAPTTISTYPPLLLRDGFYVGAQVGYGMQKNNFSFNSTFVTIPNVEIRFGVTPASVVYGLFLGYGKYLDNSIYLGAEVFSNGPIQGQKTFTVQLGPTVFSGEERMSGDIGIAILPGIKINPSTTGYLRAGYLTSFINNMGTITSHTAWQIGAGIETIICDNWSVRVQTVYNQYENKNYRFPDVDAKFESSAFQSTIGVIYRID